MAVGRPRSARVGPSARRRRAVFAIASRGGGRGARGRRDHTVTELEGCAHARVPCRVWLGGVRGYCMGY